MSRIRVRLKPNNGIKVRTQTTYLYDPTIIDAEVQQAKDWATKIDGLVEEEGEGVDYSAKAYAIGGTGTGTNNAKYYAEQAGISETNAASSASSASASEISASASAGVATSKAEQAATSATNAANSAYSAASSATSASNNAISAGNSATSAAGSASTASTQAGIATTQAGYASGYATAASNSATSASDYATKSQTWAEGTDVQVAVLGGEKSAKGWAERAKELVDSIGTVLHYKGSVATIGDLPTSGQEVGDMWNVLADGSNLVWGGTDWDEISGIVDLSEYRKASAQDTIDAGKVPTSRTVNGKALSDNISLTASDVGALPDSTVIPTVNNPTITLTQGGVTKGTFTLNQSSDKTIDFEATGATGANTSLSNLTSTGKNIGNWSTNISNCITEIPQDIKLELNNGTLTLKSGSVVTKPDGTQYQTTRDTSTTITSNGTYFILSRITNGAVAINTYATPLRTGSGSTLPADSSTYSLFFNTTDNIIYNWNWNSNQWVTIGLGFPIAIVTVSNGAISSIDQVFNGAGYIGHHAFVLPDFKVLYPDGFNTDGTFKSLVKTRPSLIFYELGSNNSDFSLFLYSPNEGSSIVNMHKEHYYEVEKYSDLRTDVGSAVQYCKKNNLSYRYINGAISAFFCTPIANYTTQSSVVTQFDILQPVRLATTEMLDTLQATVNTKANDSEVAKLADNNTFSGNNTFSSNGSVQFDGPVGLGNNAVTGITYPPYNDATQRVANTVWCQMLFANAIGTPRDVTILWGDGTAVGSPSQLDLSEEFTNFEQIGVVMSGDTGLGKSVSIKSTFWLDWLLKNTGSGAYDSVLLGNAAEVYIRIRSYNYSNPSTTTKFIMQQENGLFFYIFGINRKVVSPVNPFSS